MVEEEYTRAGAVDYTLKGTEHDSLFIAQFGGAHVQRPNGCGRKEERQQPVFGPAEFVGLEDTKAVAVEAIHSICKCDSIHLTHIGA